VKISVVTVTLNSLETINDAVVSVLSQQNVDIEYIVIDGGSTDGTLEIIEKYRDRIAMFLSEPDEGIYDALNKGFNLSTGDIIGILHSDDKFYDEHVLYDVVQVFKDPCVDYVYGDIEMVSSDGCVKRLWKSEPLRNGKIESIQIPHPSLFLSRNLLNMIKPPFDPNYRISADLKQQLIFANVLSSKGKYLSRSIVKMGLGGTSTINLRSYIKGWIESRRAWNEVHGHGGTVYVMKKVFSKIKGIRV